MRTQVTERVKELLLELGQVTDKPIGVGFGISRPEHAAQVMHWGADAAIVGSAFVKRLAEGTPTQGLAAIGTFCRSLKAALLSESNTMVPAWIRYTSIPAIFLCLTGVGTAVVLIELHF